VPFAWSAATVAAELSNPSMSNTCTFVFVGTVPCSCQFQLMFACDDGVHRPVLGGRAGGGGGGGAVGGGTFVGASKVAGGVGRGGEGRVVVARDLCVVVERRGLGREVVAGCVEGGPEATGCGSVVVVVSRPGDAVRFELDVEPAPKTIPPTTTAKVTSETEIFAQAGKARIQPTVELLTVALPKTGVQLALHPSACFRSRIDNPMSRRTQRIRIGGRRGCRTRTGDQAKW